MKYYKYLNYAKPLVIAGAGFAKHAYDEWQKNRHHHHTKSLSGKHHYHVGHPHAFKPHFRHSIFNKPHSHAKSAEVFTKTTVIHRHHHNVSKKAYLHKPSTVTKIYGQGATGYTQIAGVQRLGQATQLVVEELPYPTVAECKNFWVQYWVQNTTSGTMTTMAGLTGGINAIKAGNTQDIILHYVKKEYTLSNCATAAAYVTLYDYEYKTGQGQQATTVGGVITQWEAGLSDMEQISSANLNYLDPGATPLGNARVSAHYRLRKMNKILLQPGQVWHHTVYTQFNRKLKGEEFADINVPNYVALKGAMGLLVTAYGVPVVDSGGAGTTASTAPTSIACLVKITQKFTPFSMPFDVRYKNSTLAMPSFVTPTLIDDETDAVATAVQA